MSRHCNQLWFPCFRFLWIMLLCAVLAVFALTDITGSSFMPGLILWRFISIWLCKIFCRNYSICGHIDSLKPIYFYSLLLWLDLVFWLKKNITWKHIYRFGSALYLIHKCTLFARSLYSRKSIFIKYCFLLMLIQ